LIRTLQDRLRPPSFQVGRMEIQLSWLNPPSNNEKGRALRGLFAYTSVTSWKADQSGGIAAGGPAGSRANQSQVLFTMS
jgi:hypothetical protein